MLREEVRRVRVRRNPSLADDKLPRRRFFPERRTLPISTSFPKVTAYTIRTSIPIAPAAPFLRSQEDTRSRWLAPSGCHRVACPYRPSLCFPRRYSCWYSKIGSALSPETVIPFIESTFYKSY
jgi:hypothetical protein